MCTKDTVTSLKCCQFFLRLKEGLEMWQTVPVQSSNQINKFTPFIMNQISLSEKKYVNERSKKGTLNWELIKVSAAMTEIRYRP